MARFLQVSPKHLPPVEGEGWERVKMVSILGMTKSETVIER